MPSTASSKAKALREFSRSRLSSSICLHPSDADPSKESFKLGLTRDRAVIDYLYVWGYSLPVIACRKAGIPPLKKYVSDRMTKLENEGLIRRTNFTSKHFRQLVTLTQKGYRQAEENREMWRIEQEAKGLIADTPLPRIPLLREDRISYTTLDHDLAVQCISSEISGAIAFAPERILQGFPFRKPDALVQTRQLRQGDTMGKKQVTAIEYEKSKRSKPRSQERLLDCERVLIPNLNHNHPELNDSPGAGGINRWLFVCRTWNQANKFKKILKAGTVPVEVDRMPTHHQLHKSRYLILHTSQFNAPHLKDVLDTLEDGMAST